MVGNNRRLKQDGGKIIVDGVTGVVGVAHWQFLLMFLLANGGCLEARREKECLDSERGESLRSSPEPGGFVLRPLSVCHASSCPRMTLSLVVRLEVEVVSG